MQKLFSVIPANFFNLLASNSNKEIYAGCLLDIYDVYDREISYRLERETIKNAVLVFLSEECWSGWRAEFQSAGDMANQVLARMMKAGWLEEELDSATYGRYIIMTEQGVALAEFLQQLIRPEKEEYSAYIYNIYNTLHHREQWQGSPYINAVKSVHRNARHLANSLKKLSTFIRKIIEKMVQEKSLESLTDNLLEYCEGDFIREYARLTKQQNIHIYRTAIRAELDALMHESALFGQIVEGCMSEEGMTHLDAQEYVFSLIAAAKRFLTEDYDKIMYEIRQKINIYLNLAVGRAKFLMSHEENTRGNVEQALKKMIGDVRSFGLAADEDMSRLFWLASYEFLDTGSLRFPRRQREVVQSAATQIEEMTPEALEQAKQLIAGEAYNPYAREKMSSYVKMLLGERTSMQAKDFPLDGKKDMLALLSAVVYAGENGYEIETGDGYCEGQTFALHDFVLKEKEKQK